MTNPSQLIKFAAIGECMIELRHTSPTTLNLGYAGDTFNVALYLNRCNHKANCQTHYVTALGNDPYSNMMLSQWQQEGLNIELVSQIPNALPGLYIIHNEPNGERHFYYYRNDSAAKKLFYSNKTSAISDALINFNYIYLSGITLAILDQPSRYQLFKLLEQAKQRHAKIIFDTNYREILWPDKNVAQKVIEQALQMTDIALITFYDEQQLFHDYDSTSSIQRLQQLGIKEIVLKLGAEGCLIATENNVASLAAEPVTKIVDTTAAGDAFNGAYIAARINGLSPIDAAHHGQKLAATVIQYPGAIIPKSAMPELF